MTLRIRHVVGGVAVAFGLVGVVACVAGAYAVWRVQVPLDRERVRRSKVTTGEVTAAVRGWATSEARDRVVSALQIESRAATLSGYLQTADARLDASAATVGDVRRLLELAGGLGATADPAVTDKALD